jgi:hypothetical protein
MAETTASDRSVFPAQPDRARAFIVDLSTGTAYDRLSLIEEGRDGEKVTTCFVTTDRRIIRVRSGVDWNSDRTATATAGGPGFSRQVQARNSSGWKDTGLGHLILAHAGLYLTMTGSASFMGTGMAIAAVANTTITGTATVTAISVNMIAAETTTVTRFSTRLGTRINPGEG